MAIEPQMNALSPRVDRSTSTVPENEPPTVRSGPMLTLPGPRETEPTNWNSKLAGEVEASMVSDTGPTDSDPTWILDTVPVNWKLGGDRPMAANTPTSTPTIVVWNPRLMPGG